MLDVIRYKHDSCYLICCLLLVVFPLISKEILADERLRINRLSHCFHSKYSDFVLLTELLPPATKLGQGYVFTGVCVLFTLGVSASVHGIPPHPPRSRPPRADIPRAQSMLGDTVNARAVCILLDCILVVKRSTYGARNTFEKLQIEWKWWSFENVTRSHGVKNHQVFKLHVKISCKFQL